MSVLMGMLGIFFVWELRPWRHVGRVRPEDKGTLDTGQGDQTLTFGGYVRVAMDGRKAGGKMDTCI